MKAMVFKVISSLYRITNPTKDEEFPKEVKVGFFTSDINGKFRIVVQGISLKDVVCALRSSKLKNEDFNK